MHNFFRKHFKRFSNECQLPSRYLNWVFKVSASCSNTESKSPSKWQDCLIRELLWQIMLVGLSYIAFQYRTHMIIQWIEIWRLKYQRGYCKPESQFNYLFTLINVHLSSNSYNFWTQPNIATKFAQYVAWSILYKLRKIGEKIIRPTIPEISNFSRGYFFGAPVYFRYVIIVYHLESKNLIISENSLSLSQSYSLYKILSK